MKRNIFVWSSTVMIQSWRPKALSSGFRRGRAAGGFEFGEIGQRTIKLALQVAHAQQAADPAQELDFVHRFGEKIVGARLHAPLKVGGFIERA